MTRKKTASDKSLRPATEPARTSGAGEAIMNAQSFGPIGQVAYLVEDIDASVDRWARFSGIGPWTIYKNVALDGWWKGQDVKITMNVGLSYQDDVQMELIQVTSAAPSPYHNDDGSRIV